MGKLHITFEKDNSYIGYTALETTCDGDVLKSFVTFGQHMHTAATVTDETREAYEKTTDGITHATWEQVTSEWFAELCDAIGKSNVLNLIPEEGRARVSDTKGLRLVFWYTVS